MLTVVLMKAQWVSLVLFLGSDFVFSLFFVSLQPLKCDLRRLPLLAAVYADMFTWNEGFAVRIPPSSAYAQLNVPTMCRCHDCRAKSLLWISVCHRCSRSSCLIRSPAACRRSALPLNGNQSLTASICTFQPVGFLLAMMAVAIDDNLADSINNAKSYLPSSWAVSW